MKKFLAAVRFLTIARIPGAWGTAPADLAGSAVFFPVVGLLLGVLAAAAAWGLSLIAGPMVTAAGVVVAMLAFSGGLHMDGLSDTADGFLSSRPRERILEIMKDSHVGAMGVIAIVCTLLVKFAALVTVAVPLNLTRERGPAALWLAGADAARHPDWLLVVLTAVLMPLAGRAAINVQLALLGYARADGLGRVFYERRRWPAALWAVLLLAGVSYALLGRVGLASAVSALLVAVVFASWCQRKIGGATGDTFGAACELAELVPPLVVLCWPG